MMRRFVSSIVGTTFLSVALVAGDGSATDGVQDNQGRDILKPVVTLTGSVCGTNTYSATEIRNNPNPPRTTPLPEDQVEKGIAGVRLLTSPAPTNVVLTTAPTVFPQAPAVTAATITVSLRDASRNGFALLETRDWAGNADTTRVEIAALLPAFAQTSATAGIVRTGTSRPITLRLNNPTSAPLTISNLQLKTGGAFTVSGVTLPATIAPGGSLEVTVTYAATGNAVADQSDSLFALSDCPGVRVGAAVSGTVGVAIINSGADPARLAAEVNVAACYQAGITVTNDGNVDLVVTAVTSAAPFMYTPTNPATPVLPVTIAPGASQLFRDFCVMGSAVGVVNGTFTFNSDANGGDSVVNVSADITTSVADGDLNVEGFNSWYNDANGTLNVASGIASGAFGTVTITDIQGRVLFTSNGILASVTTIPASDMVRGVVIVTLQSGSNAKTMLVAVKG
jgi:hypothetical protein